MGRTFPRRTEPHRESTGTDGPAAVALGRSVGCQRVTCAIRIETLE